MLMMRSAMPFTSCNLQRAQDAAQFWPQLTAFLPPRNKAPVRPSVSLSHVWVQEENYFIVFCFISEHYSDDATKLVNMIELLGKMNESC